MMILNHVNCNDYSFFIFHKFYLCIYPRVMGAENVDCEFHTKIYIDPNDDLKSCKM
jgi:hypothetical protein